MASYQYPTGHPADYQEQQQQQQQHYGYGQSQPVDYMQQQQEYATPDEYLRYQQETADQGMSEQDALVSLSILIPQHLG